jgi:hypothetical protein
LSKIFIQIFYNEARKHYGDLETDGKIILSLTKHGGYKSRSFLEEQFKSNFLGQATLSGRKGFGS